MKKIPLFFILTLFTFSFSAKMETKNLQIYYSRKGILEKTKLQEHFKIYLKGFDSKYQKVIDEFILDFPYLIQKFINNMDINSNPGKPITINSVFSIINRLKEDTKYYQFIAYRYEAIIEVLPSIELQCKQFFFLNIVKM